jgi:hypothetical protein
MQPEEDREESGITTRGVGSIPTRGVGSIQPEAPADEVLQVWNKYKHAKSQWTAIEKRIRGQMTAWLAINGPIYVSETQSLRASKVTKRVCVDRLTAYTAVSDAIAEMPTKKLRAKAIESVLPAQPFRYGEVRKLVGDDVFQTIYDTETKDELKVEELDTKWMKRAKGAIEDASEPRRNEQLTTQETSSEGISTGIEQARG